MTPTPTVRRLLRIGAMSYVTLLLAIPVGLILWRSLSPGLSRFVASISTPDAIASFRLSVVVIAFVVPINVVFGVSTALVLARRDFYGKRALQAVIDLPFAVSPIVAGAALVLLWGAGGVFGFVQNDFGVRVILGLPGIVLASIFATAPFVIREVEPVLREIGTEQEKAAATLGASGWRVFSRITLPAIRLAVMYGIVLTIARTLGEYGAVVMVSPNLPGGPQTMTMLVSARQDRGDQYGAFTVATVLMALAAMVLIARTALQAWRPAAEQ